MKSNHTAFWVGLVVVVSFGVAAAFFYMLSTGVFSEKVHYVAQFPLEDGVAGLTGGADIRVGGVRMGTVDFVKPIPKHDGEPAVVRVQFPLPPDFPLYEGATVAIGSSMTGKSWLNISNQGDGQKLEEGAVIAGTSHTMGDMIDKAAAIIPRIEQMIAKAQNDVLPKIESGIESFRSAADKVGGAAGEARGMLADNRADITQTIGHARSIAATVDDKAPRITSRLDEVLADAHAALTEATSTIESMDPAITDITQMADSVHTVWVEQRGRIDDIMQTLNRASEEVMLTIQSIRAAPWRILHRPEGDLQQYQPLYDAARSFVRGAADLRSAATSLRAAAQAKGISQDRVQQMLDDLANEADDFERAQQAFFNELQAEVHNDD